MNITKVVQKQLKTNSMKKKRKFKNNCRKNITEIENKEKQKV